MADREDRKLWTVKETCDLIEVYKNFYCLWNPEHADYKDKVKRHGALTELAQTIGVATSELKRKLSIIHSQYRRERRNYKEYCKSGATAKFKSKWFGYSLMSFIHDKNVCRTSVESRTQESTLDPTDNYFSFDDEGEYADVDAKVIKEETISINSEASPENSVDSPYLYEPETSSPPMNRAESCISVARELRTAHTTNTYKERKESGSVMDEYDIFGELVARKIRNLKDSFARSTVQHLINTVLYDGEIGKYNSSNQGTCLASQNRHCTSCFNIHNSSSLNNCM